MMEIIDILIQYFNYYTITLKTFDMTQEEKELLIKDLCARLPYGVIINCIDPHFSDSTDEKLYSVNWLEQTVMSGEWTNEYNIDNIKPYLRPMSSMTEEEKEEYCNLQDKFLLSSKYIVTDAHEIFDWLNKHHFDYRGLIPMGLGIDCTGLNIYENE